MTLSTTAQLHYQHYSCTRSGLYLLNWTSIISSSFFLWLLPFKYSDNSGITWTYILQERSEAPAQVDPSSFNDFRDSHSESIQGCHSVVWNGRFSTLSYYLSLELIVLTFSLTHNQFFPWVCTKTGNVTVTLSFWTFSLLQTAGLQCIVIWSFWREGVFPVQVRLRLDVCMISLQEKGTFSYHLSFLISSLSIINYLIQSFFKQKGWTISGSSFAPEGICSFSLSYITESWVSLGLWQVVIVILVSYFSVPQTKQLERAVGRLEDNIVVALIRCFIWYIVKLGKKDKEQVCIFITVNSVLALEQHYNHFGLLPIF